jgi:hypothetical protein
MPTFRNKKLATEAAGPKPKVMPKKKGIAAKVAAGVPLIASASGVKGGRGANRAFGALTGVTAAKSGIKIDPLGVAMALPVFKLVAAAKALRAAGRIGQASALEARVLAKQAGKELGVDAVRNLGPRTLPPVGPVFRNSSERLYPRFPNIGGDSPRLLRGSRDPRTFDTYADLTNEGAGRFKGQDDLNNFVSDMGKLGGLRKVGKAAAAARQTGIPDAGSIAMVKKTAAQFGQKVSGKEAKLISRLLRGRTSK